MNIPLSSMHFALTRKRNYFPILIFGTFGANASMVIILESCLNFNDSAEAFSYKQVTYTKKRSLFTKIDLD